MELLKLKATDAEDLQVFSLCLHEALVDTQGISWRPGGLRPDGTRQTGRFAFSTQRLCHELKKKHGLLRVNCRVWVDGVLDVKHRTAVQQAGLLTLLAMVPDGADTLLLHFNDQKTVRLSAPNWHAYLEDFGTHWPAAGANT